MAKGTGSHSEMARARQSDGLSVIFDQKSPASSRSFSRSRSRSHSVSRRSYDSSRSSESSRGRDRRRRCYRSSPLSSSSSSSRSRSSSRFRSRSHPRCHRRSSRCRCDDHGRRSRGRSPRSRRSPPRCYRAHSRSFSRSPARRRRSCARSSFRWSRSRGRVSRYRSTFSRSPSRSRSRSRSSGRSVSLSLRDKRKLLKAAKANAMKTLGVEKLALPESVKPILSEPEREPEKRVRHNFEKTAAQGTEEEPNDVSSPRKSQKGKITFSINNSIAKPTAAAPPTAKVTPRVDSVESRKPYGQWIPVRSGQSSRARKHN